MAIAENDQKTTRLYLQEGQVKNALAHNAAACAFGHNHPSNCVEPSAADKRITERLKDALALIDVRVLDHIIVSPKDTYSFAEHGLL